MEHINISNKSKYKVFSNIAGVLDANTNSYSVKTEYNEDSDIPIITVNSNFEPIKIKKNFDIYWLTIVNVTTFGRTYTECADLDLECFDLMKAKFETLKDYGMTLNDISDNDILPFDRDDDRVFTTNKTYTFIIANNV